VHNWIYCCHWSVMTPEARQLIHQMTEVEVTMLYGCVCDTLEFLIDRLYNDETYFIGRQLCRKLRNAFMLKQMALHYVALINH
jgi:hypothetical protein